MMKNIFLILIISSIGGLYGRAPSLPALGVLKERIAEAPKESWSMSADGGYVFVYEFDVDGDGTEEEFFGTSLYTNYWDVLGEQRWATIKTPLEFMLLRRGDGEVTLYDSYSGEGLHKYVTEQRVSRDGVSISTKKVGEGVSLEFYEKITHSDVQSASGEFMLVRPEVRYMALKEFLSGEGEWRDYAQPEWKLSNGYHIRNEDEELVFAMLTATTDVEIEELTSFSREDAFRRIEELLNSAMVNPSGKEVIANDSRTGSINSVTEDRTANNGRTNEEKASQVDNVEIERTLYILLGGAGIALLMIVLLKRYRR